MAILVVGSTDKMFPELDEGREKFLVDVPHAGDNIDRLNPWYCELTGLYWMWRNRSTEYVGLEHYRRFFASVKTEKRRMGIAEAQEIIEGGHDMIVTEYFHGPRYTALDWFRDSNYLRYLEKFMSVLSKADRDGFDGYLRRHSLIQCNMFIGRRRVMERWCEFIFDVLSRYDRAERPGEGNRRMDGYFAEHFFGYWLERERVPVLKAPKVEIDYVVRAGIVPSGQA